MKLKCLCWVFSLALLASCTFQSDFKQQKLYSGSKIQVTLSQGAAKIPPAKIPLPFQKTYFELIPGKCRLVALRAAGQSYYTTRLKACYNGLTLFLDDTVRIDANPLWQEGFTYKEINSQGVVKLQNISVKIQALNEKDKYPIFGY